MPIEERADFVITYEIDGIQKASGKYGVKEKLVTFVANEIINQHKENDLNWNKNYYELYLERLTVDIDNLETEDILKKYFLKNEDDLLALLDDITRLLRQTKQEIVLLKSVEARLILDSNKTSKSRVKKRRAPTKNQKQVNYIRKERPIMFVEYADEHGIAAAREYYGIAKIGSKQLYIELSKEHFPERADLKIDLVNGKKTAQEILKKIMNREPHNYTNDQITFLRTLYDLKYTYNHEELETDDPQCHDIEDSNFLEKEEFYRDLFIAVRKKGADYASDKLELSLPDTLKHLTELYTYLAKNKLFETFERKIAERVAGINQ